MDDWVISVLNTSNTTLIEWALLVVGTGFVGLSTAKIQGSTYTFSGVLNVIKKVGLSTSIATFFGGMLIVVFASFYGESVTAPVSWFHHLPAKEASFFRSSTDHRKDPISVFDFANLESKYQEIAPSRATAMLTQQRAAML